MDFRHKRLRTRHGSAVFSPFPAWNKYVCTERDFCHSHRLNDVKTEKTSAQTIFQNGQIWKMVDSSLQIDLVGKTLVHYKHYKGETKRAPVSLASKEVLAKFLKQNKAVLTKAAPAKAAASKG